MPECAETVRSLVDARARPGNPSGTDWEDLVDELGELGPECSDALVAAAREALDGLVADDDGAVYVLLCALARRKHPEARALLVRAIGHELAPDKEYYAAWLGWLDADAAADEALIAVLDAGGTRPDLVATVHTLWSRRVDAAVPHLVPLLDHPDAAVRVEIVGALDNFDAGDAAADALRDRLSRESDPRVERMLTDTLARWGS